MNVCFTISEAGTEAVLVLSVGGDRGVEDDDELHGSAVVVEKSSSEPAFPSPLNGSEILFALALDIPPKTSLGCLESDKPANGSKPGPNGSVELPLFFD